jgi:hypothetical protein
MWYFFLNVQTHNNSAKPKADRKQKDDDSASKYDRKRNVKGKGATRKSASQVEVLTFEVSSLFCWIIVL